MNLRLKRHVSLLAAVFLAGTLPLWAGQALAENNVAPAIVLRQQVSDDASMHAMTAMQQAMADISQSQPQNMNAKTEAK